jgi:hypothetical protein
MGKDTEGNVHGSLRYDLDSVEELVQIMEDVGSVIRCPARVSDQAFSKDMS